MGLLSENSVAGFDPYPDADKADMSDMAPEGITDLGQLSGLLGGRKGNIGDLADKVTGVGMFGNAIDAFGDLKEGDLMGVAGNVLGTLSGYLGLDGALGFMGDLARDVESGFSPEDSVIGNLLDYGLDLGLIGVGSLMGPIGSLLGGIAAGKLDASGLAKGFSAAASKFGKEMDYGVNMTMYEGMEKMGYADSLSGLEKSVAKSNVESYGIDKYGGAALQGIQGAANDWGGYLYGESGGQSGFGKDAMGDADATDSQTGQSGAHGMMGAGYGPDVDASENEGYGPGHFGGGGGEADSDSGGMGIGDADGADAGGGEGIY